MLESHLRETAAVSDDTSLFEESLAHILDQKDHLSSFRSQFLFPKKAAAFHSAGEGFPCHGDPESPTVYLCGNSLGLQPVSTRQRVLQELDDWSEFGVEGHWRSKYPWLTADEQVTEQLAALVGAKREEVVAMNSLTTNLHLLMLPFYRPTTTRFKIVIEFKSFPSDLYAVESQIKHHGLDPEIALIQLKPRDGELCLREEDIISILEKEGQAISLVMLSGVQYYTGQFFNIPLITASGHKQGAIVGWDLAHAVGNVPLYLHDWQVDFAAWCHYKYLNSGPGSIGGAFVHGRHSLPDNAQEKVEEVDLPIVDSTVGRLLGWWSHDLASRFQMDAPFSAIPGAFGFRLSNPPILQLASLHASVDVFIAAGGIKTLRKKSLLLTGYLEILLNHFIPSQSLQIITPPEPERRGSQLSLKFQQDVTKIQKCLLARGIICDERKPDVLRVAPTALYNSFHDVWSFVQGLKIALETD